jgi:hypothetical protein
VCENGLPGREKSVFSIKGSKLASLRDIAS